MIKRMPAVRSSDGIGKIQQVQFGGYWHTPAAQDGEIYDMENMSGRDFPLLSTRHPRWRLINSQYENRGIYAHDGIYCVSRNRLYKDGERKGEVKNLEERRQFVSIGAYIIILPDMMYYNRLTDEIGDLSATWTGAVEFRDGEYAGVAAKGNTMVTTGDAFPFRAGDAVTISGSGENDKSIIIREVSEDGKTLVFYENSFVNGGGDAVTVSREVPALRFACENENRLWGCDGDTIYASKPGDPFNFNVFDGLSTDSYAVTVGSAGDFTGCISFMGYPCFFKENQIYKVYGSKPSDFQVMGSASLGVAEGSHASLAVAGEVLYYLSRVGIVAYAGGIPQSVAEAFGGVRYRDAVGGSDGVRYYVSMLDEDGKAHLFCYDTDKRMWHREDGIYAVGFAYHKDRLLMADRRNVYQMGNGEKENPEGTLMANSDLALKSFVEFGDFVEGSPNRKGTAKLQMRVELEAGATLTVKMMFDSDGEWRHVAELTTEKKRSYYLPIIPRRCDHFRIRLEGVGEWRLYSLTREHYSGSEI